MKNKTVFYFWIPLVLFVSCIGKNIPPRVQTISKDYITHNSAIIKITITDGTYANNIRGVVYGTEPMPTIEDGQAFVSNDINKLLSVALTELTPGTTYYARGYVENYDGNNYGEELHFTTRDAEIFTDPRDGNQYTEVVIWNQTWMGEDLNYDAGENCKTTYHMTQNGEMTDEERTRFGVLYNTEICNEVCPSGWHLPTDGDWKTLEFNLGTASEELDSFLMRGENLITELKHPGEKYWNGSHLNFVTNATGFTALPAGTYNSSGYSSYGSWAYFWSATLENGNRIYRYMNDYETGIYRKIAPDDNTVYFSVRCIKDDR